MGSAMRATVARDCGLPVEFLDEAAEMLNAARADANATVEYPGILCFDAGGRRWATGLTGLHVNDTEGFGDGLPGDEALVALESAGEISTARYVDVLSSVLSVRANEAREGGG